MLNYPSNVACGLSAADVAAVVDNNRGGGGLFGNGENASWWIIILFLFVFCGWGNGGFGGGFGNNGGVGAYDNYVLTSDFSQLSRQIDSGFASQERKLDGINNGICSLGYDQLAQMNGINQNVSQVGYNTLNAIQQNGYETRNAVQQGQIAQMQGFNALQAQLAQCCCDNREAIAGVNYNLATQASGIGRQIERGFADTNYAMATQNCATLQAIDKVGDRVIDYLANKENQNLRDENFALRLAASQEKQNSFLVDQLKAPCPIPAYITCNPNAPLNYNVTYGNGCGCA